MGLNVGECTEKAESHPGRWVSSHSCLAKVMKKVSSVLVGLSGGVSNFSLFLRSNVCFGL